MPNPFMTRNVDLTAEQIRGPQGIMGLLQRPGVREGLLAASAALLQQSGQPGTLGQAIGNALPVGIGAGRAAQRQQEFEQLLQTLPPGMASVARILGPDRGAPLIAQAMQAPERDVRNVDGRLVDITGEPEVIFESPAEDTSAQDARDAQKLTFDQENALADDFRSQTGSFQEIALQVKRAQAATDTAVGDQTRIIALNKLLDPGSIVREGEFQRVGEAGGLDTRAQFYFNRLVDGRLPDDLRREIDQEIAAQTDAARGSFSPLLNQFTERATSFGLDPTRVVTDFFDGLPTAAEMPSGGDVLSRFGLSPVRR